MVVDKTGLNQCVLITVMPLGFINIHNTNITLSFLYFFRCGSPKYGSVGRCDGCYVDVCDVCDGVEKGNVYSGYNVDGCDVGDIGEEGNVYSGYNVGVCDVGDIGDEGNGYSGYNVGVGRTASNPW